MTAFPDERDTNWRRRLRSAVLKWYDGNGRRLPWRESADPYRIWVSEIMLQQTTIAAVIPYFERFTQRFPDVNALAAADQSEVLRLWEGLGYYSRARNLHKAAIEIVDRFAGTFPDSAAELVQLPGIGRYTAGAIASFAFGQPAGIVEANTLRLYSRLIAMTQDPRGTAGQKTLWSFADWIVAPGRPADFNQAVMDLGSTVCRPTAPECSACPLKSCCAAFSRGMQESIPLAGKKPGVTDVTEVSIAVRRGGRYLLRQRTSDERWAGLWDFVRFEVADDDVRNLDVPTRPQHSAAAAGCSVSRTTSDAAPAFEQRRSGIRNSHGAANFRRCACRADYAYRDAVPDSAAVPGDG
ncbi:MAG: A/G-specific adenine glycosylase [Planctomycetaceae bacterium]